MSHELYKEQLQVLKLTMLLGAFIFIDIAINSH